MVDASSESVVILRTDASEDGQRLDAFLSRRLGLGRNLAHQLIIDGLVAVNGLPSPRPATPMRAGYQVRVATRPAPDVSDSVPYLPRLVYQDDLIAVVDKPAGLVVHAAPGHRGQTLADIVRGWDGPWSATAGAERPGIVHRLDRGTSGLMVLARTDKAHLDLANQLRTRTLGREYWAMVRGGFREDRGRIDAAVGRDPAQPRRMAVTGEGREAATEFFVLERLPEHTALRLRLLSGRTHQIRVHLAYIGRPLAGDWLYGAAREEQARPALHAAMLHLRHPGAGREMVFCSALPPDLQRLRQALGGEHTADAVWPWNEIQGARW